MSDYVLDSRAAQAAGRFDGLSALFDRSTDHHFEAIGVGPGWRCWEVGAGGPGVPRLLVERGGTVLATDIETGLLDGVPARVEVLRHDVRDEPPGSGFDLIHARLVLAHLPERAAVLRRLTGAQRPGGWLFVEDVDTGLAPTAFLDPLTDIEHLGNKIRAGFIGLLGHRGVDGAFGRKLPRLLRACGLVDIVADGRVTLEHPGGAALERANIDQVRDALTDLGYTTADEIDTYLSVLDDLTPAGPPLISAYGRRPG